MIDTKSARPSKTLIDLFPDYLSCLHDLLTAKLQDYADLIKFLNMSKT